MRRKAANGDAQTLAGIPAEGERRPGLRAAGVAAARIAAPVVAKRGGGALGRLKAEWAAAAGPDLAALIWPEALGRDGVLKLRVAAHAALELQHRAPLVIERLNGFLGQPAVSRLVFVQGLTGGSLPSAASREPLSAAAEATLAEQVAAVENPVLRAALAGLGRLVLARRR
jgi:hypothetical protein